MKKFLAISVLSLGILSSVPSAFCAQGDANNANGANRQPNRVDLGYSNIMIPVFNFSKDDLIKYLFLSKRTGGVIEKLKVNPVGIYSLQDVRLLPYIETFEDHHQLTPDEDRNNHVNTFLEKVKTLIYYPESFDVQRFREILNSNNVEDLKNIRPITKKDSRSQKDVLCLCGNRWDCIIHQFSGVNYRVEYYDKVENKRIIFLFRPSMFNGSIVESFSELLDGYGLRELIDVRNTLKTFAIPTGVTEIGNFTFYECEALEKIEIPNSVTSIGKHAFGRCTPLKEIKIPNSVTSIGNAAFNGCISLKEIKIPNSVTSIGNHAFSGCTSLEKITIPNSVKKIGWNAFYECESLKKIEIPNSVTEISKGAFAGCTSLKEIEWNGNTYGVEEFLNAFKNRLKS